MRTLTIKTEYVWVFNTFLKIVKDTFSDVNIVCVGGDDNDATPPITILENMKKIHSCTTSGMYIQMFNESSTVFIDCKLSSDEFNTFNCSNAKQVLGVNMSNFHKMVDSMSSAESLTMYIDDENSNMFNMSFENADKASSHKISFRLLDIALVRLTIKAQPFQIKMTMGTTEFHKMAKDMAAIGEELEIIITNKRAIFRCKGDIVTRESIHEPSPSSDTDIVVFDNQSEVCTTGLFNIKDLASCTKCNSLSPTLTFYMRNDFPLLINYDVSCLGEVSLYFMPLHKND